MIAPSASWVVVSGATSGIGLATTKSLLECGYRVAGLGRKQAALESLESTLGDCFRGIQVDLAERSSINTCQRVLESLEGSVRGVVSNAAECVYQSVLDLEIDRLARLLSVNVLGPIALAQSLSRRLEPGGSFIHVSSVTTRFLPGPKFAAYAATKAAMETLVDGLRLELAPRQIRVSTITPGLVDTPIYDKVAGFDGARRKISEQVPQWLQPEIVANAIIYILSQPEQVNIADLVLTPTLQAR